MLQYIIRRLISGLFILFLFVSLVFFSAQALLPGDFVSHYAFSLSPSEAEELRTQLGLGQPVWQSYLQWLANLARGDLGLSYTPFGAGPPVSEVLKSVLPSSILVFGLGTGLAFLIGQWLGKFTAWRGPGLVSGAITFGSIILYTSFPPWLSFLLTYIFVRYLGILSLPRGVAVFRSPQVDRPEVMAQMVAGFAAVLAALLLFNYLLQRFARRKIPGFLFVILLGMGWMGTWALNGSTTFALEILEKASLPILTFTLLSFGEIMLVMRTTMADSRHEDYINTARAKGLADKDVRDRHAARTALLPVLSRLMISLPYLFTGMVMIEQVLGWAGVGTTLFFAVGNQNVPLMMGMALVIGVFSLVVRLILDILYAVLDPRTRSEARLVGRII